MRYRYIVLGFASICVVLAYYGYQILMAPHRLFESVRLGDYATFASLLTPELAKRPYRLSLNNTLYLTHLACSDSPPEFVNLLLENGADVHQKDSRGRSCVFHAIGRDDNDVAVKNIEVLYRHDPTVLDDRISSNGDTVLHFAISIRVDSRLIQRLIELGADKSALNLKGETPYQVLLKDPYKDDAVEKLLQ